MLCESSCFCPLLLLFLLYLRLLLDNFYKCAGANLIQVCPSAVAGQSLVAAGVASS